MAPMNIANCNFRLGAIKADIDPPTIPAETTGTNPNILISINGLPKLTTTSHINSATIGPAIALIKNLTNSKRSISSNTLGMTRVKHFRTNKESRSEMSD